MLSILSQNKLEEAFFRVLCRGGGVGFFRFFPRKKTVCQSCILNGLLI